MISFGAMLHHFCEWRKQEEYHSGTFFEKEIKMRKMTRYEAIAKIAGLNLNMGPSKLVDTLAELGLIEFEKEKEYINLISNNNYYQFTFKEMQDALANYGYQIVKKAELIHTPSIVYLSELGSNVNFKCIKDALSQYGLTVTKNVGF